MTRMTLQAELIVLAATAVASASAFVDMATNPGHFVHDRSGQIQTVDYVPGNGDGSGTSSNSYTATDPEALQGFDTQININAAFTESHSQNTHLRFTGTTNVHVETFAQFDFGGGEFEAFSEDEGEGEPEPEFIGNSSTINLNAHTFVGIYGGNQATAFDVRLSESGSNPTAPAYVNMSTDNPANSDDYRYFRIAATGGEKIGDEVEVQLGINYSTDTRYGGPSFPTTNVANGSTTNGMLLNTELDLDITLNGTSVDLGTYTPGDGNDLATSFTAQIGDTIGISYDLISQIGTFGNIVDIPTPDAGLFANAHALGTLSLNMNMFSEVGTSQDNPITAITPPTNPGDPFVLIGHLDEDTGVGFEIPLWFDPPIAIGYELEIIGADIETFELPEQPFDADGFEISVWNGTEWEDLGTYLNEEDEFLNDDGFTRIRIEGIDESLALDPLDDTAFAVGLTFKNVTGLTGQPNSVQVNMTPIIIPEPMTFSLLALMLMRCRRRA